VLTVTSRVDYCNSVLHHVSAASVHPLQNVLNSAARIILHERNFDHIITDVRDWLHRLAVQQRIEYKVCVLVYKCLYQAAPTYLAELCSPASESANRGHFRSAAWGDLAVPRSRTTRYGYRCFAVSGPTLEFTRIVCSCFVIDTDPVLCVSEDCIILHSIRNTSIAPTWRL